jgi:Werner syndrome ATP-dependent helicase
MATLICDKDHDHDNEYNQNKSYYITLKKYFNFDSFRDKQLDIIKTILEDKRDVTATMFTSAGKSLCYQFPAVHTNKLVLVVSPLISLMSDQVFKLTELNIPAITLNSTVSNKNKLIREIINNKYRLVYVTPEYLITPPALELINNLYNLDLLVCISIDESHCVSSWGHDFRESYRKLDIIKKTVNIPVLALTATATPTVRTDIITSLNLINPLIVNTTFDRPNIFIRITRKQSIYLDLLPHLKSKEPTIIYCTTRKDTETINTFLKQHNIMSDVYHAGLEPLERELVHEDFTNNKIDCVVATVAFGMGIDKVIRQVIHYGVPQDIESYYQEIGRAGRDKEPSRCILYYNYSDFTTTNYIISQIQNISYRKKRLNMLNIMKKYLSLETCRREYILNYFGETYDRKNCNSCDNCIKSCKDFLYPDSTFIEKIIKEQVKTDVTLEACMMLNVTYETGNKFGLGTIILILRGSNAKNITVFHKKLRYYGLGHNKTVEWWKRLAHALVGLKYLGEKSYDGGKGFMIFRTLKGKKWLDTVFDSDTYRLKDDHEKLMISIK